MYGVIRALDSTRNGDELFGIEEGDDITPILEDPITMNSSVTQCKDIYLLNHHLYDLTDEYDIDGPISLSNILLVDRERQSDVLASENISSKEDCFDNLSTIDGSKISCYQMG